MTGILIELLLSWLLLWLIEKRHLNVLGLTPSGVRLSQFAWGLVVAAIFCVAYNLLTTAFISNKWVLKKHWSISSLPFSIWWVFKSVLFEELIFRGALLYIAIKRLGIQKACLLSAICFGAYHWFSYGILGNPVQMLFVFIATALAGWMFALAFAKTGSLYLPFALHLGWNLINILLFSNGPLGAQILVRSNDMRLEGGLSLLIYLFQVLGLPLFVIWQLRQKTKWKTGITS